MSDLLSEYIKHARHFDGLGMGDQDLEERAKVLEQHIEALAAELKEHHLKHQKELGDIARSLFHATGECK